MRKFLQLIRPFRETRNIVALCLAFFLCAGTLWAQTDYSTTYTSGVDLSTTGGTSASLCKVIINNVEYDGLKAGTSSVAGAVKITVPENTKYLHFHVAGWNGKSVTMSVTSTGYSDNINLTSNTGIANNSPFTFNGDASASDYYKVITFSEALSEDTEFTFTAVTGNRFVIWGVNAEEGTTPTNNPSIAASNVELAYDATSGQIEYTINNPANNGVLTASTNAEWLANVAVPANAAIVTFTTTANATAAQRTGTITLTYTYGDNQIVTKNVTVTQAGNPNVIDNISDITAVGTYTVQGTIVAKSQRGFIVGDGTGYVYYYNQNYTESDYNIGDIVKLSGAVVVYNGVYEFNNTTTVTTAATSNYVTEEPTVLTGGDMDTRVASTTPADLSSYVQYQGKFSVSGNYYNITDIDGANTAIGSISYPLEADFASLNGRTVVVKGYYVGISSSTYYNTMIGSITEVVSTEPAINVANTTLNVDFGANNGNIAVTFENLSDDEVEAAYAYLCDANGGTAYYDWIDVDMLIDEVIYTISVNQGEARTAYFKVCSGNVCSDIVTVNQAAYVAPPQDYAELPFEFNSGRDAIEQTDGLSQNGLGSDYNVTANPNTQLKFDGTGDWLLLHFNEVPGTLSFDIKGNGFSDGTFTVQTSEDGVTYDELVSYNLDNEVQNEEFGNLDEDIRYIRWIYTEKVTGNVGLGNIKLTKPSTAPGITVTQTLVDVPADGVEEDYVSVSTVNMGEEPVLDLRIVAEDGETPASYDWFTATLENYDIIYNAVANTGEERYAYMRVHGQYDGEDVYSELITVVQAGIVADYATLPFEFNGGKAAIDTTDGLTQDGLGNDYNTETTKLRFDNTGDWLELHFDGTPGKLSFDIKGNTFSGGTFTVQTSEDGVTYSDLETYTTLGNTQTEEFFTIGTNVRYIKWIYTEKANGNVGLGNIILAQPSTEPVITLTPSSVEAPAASVAGTLTMTYVNMGEDPLFTVQFFAEDGETYASYNWISASVDDEMNVSYSIEANDGEARTAYLKVYGLTDEYEEAYSNLVTISQAAAPQQYELTVSEFENLEIFTFVDNMDELALEGAGTITLNEGDTVYLSVSANEGYVLSTLVVDGQSVLSQLDETGLYTFTMPGHDVTVTATAVEFVPGNWVLTSLADLTEDDVFVIVETNGNVTNALPSDNGSSSAPAAVGVTVVDNTLSGEPAANLQWNLSISDDGYTFYPNGTTDTWLFCNNTNNGVRVGTGDNSVFTVSDTNTYLYNVGTGRFIGVYNNQDWRCYTTINSNIAGQTFAFYKKVASTTDLTQTIALVNGTNWVSFNVETTLNDLKAALVDAAPNTTIKIIGQNNYTTYNPNNHRWSGTLSWDLSKMYKIQVSTSCEISLEGTPIDPSEHAVTIVNGNNYLGFPFNQTMTLTDAFAGFAANGDKILSQTGSATYNRGRWQGTTLTQLQPGKGYIYKSTASENRPLVFPNSSR